MRDLADLIAKLEAATEGSEALDEAIACALGFVISATTSGLLIMRKPAKDGDPAWDLPRYTRSIDAALTLVPEGACWEAGTVDGCASVWRESSPSFFTEEYTGTSWSADGDTFNEALALCIAALKARAAP